MSAYPTIETLTNALRAAEATYTSTGDWSDEQSVFDARTRLAELRRTIDRMWRNPCCRKKFESETGHADSLAISYQTAFSEWAAEQVSA